MDLAHATYDLGRAIIAQQLLQIVFVVEEEVIGREAVLKDQLEAPSTFDFRGVVSPGIREAAGNPSSRQISREEAINLLTLEVEEAMEELGEAIILLEATTRMIKVS